jgi:hypothetical protein
MDLEALRLAEPGNLTAVAHPLGLSKSTASQHLHAPSRAPGRFGGRNKMQIVLGPFIGDGAKTAKGLIDTDPSECHFGEIPTRTHRITASRPRELRAWTISSASWRCAGGSGRISRELSVTWLH